MQLHDSQDGEKPPREEQISLFPSLVYFDVKRGHWRAIVQGRICDASRVPMATRLLIKGLKRALRATPDELAGEIFRQRIQGFASKPVPGRRIAVDIGGHQFVLRRRSKRNGTFLGICRLPTELMSTPLPPTLAVRLIATGGREQVPSELESLLHVVPPRGISVVSDIDDTIKATEVASRHLMLTNTFLRPFTAISGMAELYSEWREAGAAFHYVSSSPWQLFQPLAELCELSQFPAGSMHLRYFRIRDEMLLRWRPGRRKGKAAIIAGLMTKLPQRQFILVGDSGERDPEIYRFLAQKFPGQVRAILIRQLDAKPLGSRRIQKLQLLAPRVTVELYKDADDLRQRTSQLLKSHA
jgi:phosphatidate phosphatase APP1